MLLLCALRCMYVVVQSLFTAVLISRFLVGHSIEEMALAKERSKRRPLQLVGGEVGPM